ncbi:acetate--CoA ligase [Ichthyenterobacterium magnum]|uniref:Acetate--CoA ligase n=1 Tax=Ichthyenterobacterium magnum TaxID=1230530 RepID=A0A420DKJ1_9FLAO|nr:acetate--CoA ligase [Ichthyenterobacterium magnum]RKE94776.1 acetyl-coenzyme A synthetase [Ichthyenterobacterium magnum]
MHRFQINSYPAYQKAYKRSIEEPEAFWDEIASSFVWRKKWTKTLEWDFTKPEVKWFQGGQLNITENCLDRHLEKRANQTALIFEPNNPNDAAQYFTYKALHSKVCQFANVLKANNVKKGDRVCIYMPMVPELTFAVLACARIGAVHSVVFAGFSAAALSARINDAACKVLLTADGGFRGDKITPLKSIADDALKTCPSIEKTIVLNRTNSEVIMQANQVWWHEELSKVDDNCPVEIMDAEDMLFILYTSGSTGKPKGMVHTCGGYMVYTAYTFRNVFQYRSSRAVTLGREATRAGGPDVYWCTADIGWITGHSYIVYGPLANGATTVMFEGVPSYPDYGRFWEICEKHKVNQFYTAPTAIRALAKHPINLAENYNLKHLKTLGTVGEPINDEAWNWYNDYVGKGKCPIVDTWWQTETGGIMISSLAGVTRSKATYATLPLPGIQPVLLDENGEEIVGNPAQGILAIKFPWPSIARTIYGNHERYKNVYFSAYKGKYFPGDGALRDEVGDYRITGRVDDVIIVSGHNLGTAPIENAINEHEAVVESAVVGFPHDIKGNALYAYVILYDGYTASDELLQSIRQKVADTIGPIAKPDKIQFTQGLPKTRSGKIMRRILRKIAHNDTTNLGDTSTLLNPEVVQSIIDDAI